MSAVQSDNRPYLTPCDISRILGCHPSAPIRWLSRGSVLSSGERLKLQAVRTPGGWRIRQDWLDSFLEAMTADRMKDAPETAPRPGRRPGNAELESRLAAAGF